MNEDIQNVVESIRMIQEESSISKNVQTKLDEIITTLQQEGEVTMRVNKALDQLESIIDDVNLESYTRTQLWSLSSMLESISS